MDTTSTPVVNVLQPTLGAHFVGKRPDHEAGQLKLLNEAAVSLLPSYGARQQLQGA